MGWDQNYNETKRCTATTMLIWCTKLESTHKESKDVFLILSKQWPGCAKECTILFEWNCTSEIRVLCLQKCKVPLCNTVRLYVLSIYYIPYFMGNTFAPIALFVLLIFHYPQLQSLAKIPIQYRQSSRHFIASKFWNSTDEAEPICSTV